MSKVKTDIKNNNEENNIKESRFSKKNILIMIFSMVLVLIAGTFAWYSWQSNKTAMVLTVGDINKVQVTLSPYQFNGSLEPTTTYEDNEYVQVTAVNNQDAVREISLFYQINSVDTALVNEDFKYMVLRSTNGSNYSEYSSGNFSAASSSSDFIIFDGEEIAANSTYYYRVYIWIDGSDNDNTEMQGSIFDAELRASIISILNGADPVVPTGLIPVTIANDGTVTTADTSSEWYNYTDKEWANAVLVSSNGTQTREYYASNSNVTVNQDDILAYYVWVPKYSYKMNGTEESISISFNSTPSGYTEHPAFTFEDGQLGVWVGKFETTGSATTPTILPNTSPLVSQNVSTQFQTALKFAGGTLSSGAVAFAGSDTYGLTDEVNSHMMKNSEWGAAAYLSHSIYGINGEIRINNYYSSGMKTGCGADVAEDSSTSTCEIAYGGATEYPQSTTGNITGIFDMTGGAWEYVMGVFANASGSLWTGNTSIYNSGFNGLYGSSGTSYTSGIAFPTETKYYDKYQATSGTTISATTACSGGVCYGHALSETSGWHSDTTDFATSSNPWFERGGGYKNGANAGAFYFNSHGGHATSSYGFRSVLVA